MTRRPPTPPRPRDGFTLIEMVVVLAIVAVLAMAAAPLQEMTLRRVKEQALREALRSIRSALDAHRLAVEAGRIARGPNGTPWPASLDVLVQGLPLLDEQGRPRDDRARLYLLRKLPRDPFAATDPETGAAGPAAQSWGQRASTSPPSAPAAGADVFDVFSRAETKALDGSVYRDW